MDYQEMLAIAQSKKPQSAKARERFEVPKIQGHVEGEKTVLSNFSQIAQVIRRQTAHLVKFITKELAVPSANRSSEVILGRKVSSASVNEKIKKYVDEFVLCPQCGGPDTDLIQEKKNTSIKCNVCGAKTPVRDFI
jgi:translation initiation factor 2 subunit 2